MPRGKSETNGRRGPRPIKSAEIVPAVSVEGTLFKLEGWEMDGANSLTRAASSIQKRRGGRPRKVDEHETPAELPVPEPVETPEAMLSHS